MTQTVDNQQLFERLTNGNSSSNVRNGKDKTVSDIFKSVPKYEELRNLESKLKMQSKLNFNSVFHEPVGNYLIRTYLVTEHSLDKAVFVSDVELFKKLNDPSGRRRVAEKIYYQFLAPETQDHIEGVSVFASPQDEMPWYAHRKSTFTHASHLDASEMEDSMIPSLSSFTENTNSIGVYGKSVVNVKERIERHDTDDTGLFDRILQEVLDDLRLDVFPRFCRSHYYQTYIRCKAMETAKVTIKDFTAVYKLGKGAFGLVHACRKNNYNKLYAMKQMSKGRIQETHSLRTVMQERDYLAMMSSKFVTSLKYAIHDEKTIYLIMDLMLGGDLKHHLNNEGTFSVDRTRFHTAQMLLGLDHIHTKGIVYRDLKLENVLVDEFGHIKISDLGLAINVGKSGKIRGGYAGTPGYIAPEVILGTPYNHLADYFSLGVMVYRCLCGKKPFERRNRKKKHHERQRQSAQLDRNVIEMEPEMPAQYFSGSTRSILKGLMAKNPKTRLGYHGIEEIKQHPWFAKIDFGLLEAGYLDPPFECKKLEHDQSPPDENEQVLQRDIQYLNVEIKDDFNKQLDTFDFISKAALQEELVDVLKQADVDKSHNMDDMDDNNENYDSVVNPSRNKSCLGGCVVS